MHMVTHASLLWFLYCLMCFMMYVLQHECMHKVVHARWCIREILRREVGGRVRRCNRNAYRIILYEGRGSVGVFW